MSFVEMVSVRNRRRENAASNPKAVLIELKALVFSNIKASKNTTKLIRKKVKKKSLL